MLPAVSYQPSAISVAGYRGPHGRGMVDHRGPRVSGEAVAGENYRPWEVPVAMGEPEPKAGGRELERIIFFSDAVFAIAITLLVLEIRVPSREVAAQAGGLGSALLHLWPSYLGYAISRGKLLTLDAGHYHPTESISDKISSVLQFLPEILDVQGFAPLCRRSN